MNALVVHPAFGSVWLEHARMEQAENGRWYVVGETWDDTGIGSLYMPDDWRGEPVLMNFPATCIMRVE